MNNLNYDIPLFVPSFSSKGNILLPQKDGKYISDNYELLNLFEIQLFDAYLLSAYDIYYGLMPQNPDEWPATRYLFIDSGGYETNDSYDLSEKNKFNYKVYPWDESKMIDVYKPIISCPKFNNTSIILSSFDNCKPVSEQLSAFSLLQNRFPEATINCLIKITDSIVNVVDSLVNSSFIKGIKILGFTEKELGYNIQERLKNILFIRHELSLIGWDGLIHIFGGLEPSISKLYFAAGADVFDGLSWQKIRYKNTSTLYNPYFYNISISEEENKALMMFENINELHQIKNDLALLCDNRQETSNMLKEMLNYEDIKIFDLLEKLEV